MKLKYELDKQKVKNNMTNEEAKRNIIHAIRWNDMPTKEALNMVIKALEYTMWIPVSERLPELYTFVYATCHSLVDDRENWVIETCYVPIPKEYNSRRFSDWGNIPMLNHGEAEVIAWMKRDIPEPYKAESEG